MSDKIQDAIGEVMDGIVSMIEKKNDALCSDIIKTEIVQKALLNAKNGDIEDFYFSVLYPIENLIDGISQQISSCGKTQFILTHSQFIERHFEGLIRQHEGFACCADKSRTIMEKLFLAYLNDEEIQFNYDAEYTYHLPKKIFKTHDEIIMFFDGIFALYYGKPKKYLMALQSINKAAALLKERGL